MKAGVTCLTDLDISVFKNKAQILKLTFNILYRFKQQHKLQV